MPIRRKLVVIIMSVTAAALLLSGLSLVVFDIVLFRTYLQRDLSTLAQVVADNAAVDLSFNDSAAAKMTLATLRARPMSWPPAFTLLMARLSPNTFAMDPMPPARLPPHRNRSRLRTAP